VRKQEKERKREREKAREREREREVLESRSTFPNLVVKVNQFLFERKTSSKSLERKKLKT